jgi:hypothetical protein
MYFFSCLKSHVLDCVFDGASLYSSVPLPVDLGRVHEIVARGRSYPVTIVSEKKLVLSEPNSPDSQALISLLNIVLKKVREFCVVGTYRKRRFRVLQISCKLVDAFTITSLLSSRKESPTRLGFFQVTKLK